MDSKTPLTNDPVEEITLQPPFSSPTPAVSINKQILQPTPATVEITKADVPETVKGPFIHTTQGPIINALVRGRSTPKNTKEEGQTAYTTLTIKTGTSFLEVFLPDYASKGGLTEHTSRLLVLIMHLFNENKKRSQDVFFSISQYMEFCNLKDEKEARIQLKKAFGVLQNTHVTFKTDIEKFIKIDGEHAPKGDGYGNNSYNINITSLTNDPIKRGIAHFRFNYDFFQILKKYRASPFPRSVLASNAKLNPNSTPLLYKLCENKIMNEGKKNQDLVSVQILIEDVANHIPSYEAVSTADRHYYRRIIEPFIRDMNALSETLSWILQDNTGKEVSKESLIKIAYHDFIKLSVKVIWKVDYNKAIEELRQLKGAKFEDEIADIIQ